MYIVVVACAMALTGDRSLFAFDSVSVGTVLQGGDFLQACRAATATLPPAKRKREAVCRIEVTRHAAVAPLRRRRRATAPPPSLTYLKLAKTLCLPRIRTVLTAGPPAKPVVQRVQVFATQF